MGVEIELACGECGCVIVLVDPLLDIHEGQPLCMHCRGRHREGCEDDLLDQYMAPKPGPRRV